jgi:hypothetical protein
MNKKTLGGKQSKPPKQEDNSDDEEMEMMQNYDMIMTNKEFMNVKEDYHQAETA